MMMIWWWWWWELPEGKHLGDRASASVSDLRSAAFPTTFSWIHSLFLHQPNNRSPGAKIMILVSNSMMALGCVSLPYQFHYLKKKLVDYHPFCLTKTEKRTPHKRATWFDFNIHSFSIVRGAKAFFCCSGRSHSFRQEFPSRSPAQCAVTGLGAMPSAHLKHFDILCWPSFYQVKGWLIPASTIRQETNVCWFSVFSERLLFLTSVCCAGLVWNQLPTDFLTWISWGEADLKDTQVSQFTQTFILLLDLAHESYDKIFFTMFCLFPSCYGARLLEFQIYRGCCLWGRLDDEKTSGTAHYHKSCGHSSS